MIVTTLSDAIRTRRSIRRYEQAAISDSQLQRVLTAATWAPSAHNRQPWRFALLRSAGAKEKLARAMGEQLFADRRRDGDDEGLISKDVARSFARITGAPVVLIVCLTLDDMDLYADEKRMRAEHTMAVQSTAMAIQNLLLAASAENLGACWMCAPLFCPKIVIEALSLPNNWEPQAMVTLGKPANHGKPPVRQPLDQMLVEIF